MTSELQRRAEEVKALPPCPHCKRRIGHEEGCPNFPKVKAKLPRKAKPESSPFPYPLGEMALDDHVPAHWKDTPMGKVLWLDLREGHIERTQKEFLELVNQKQK